MSLPAALALEKLNVLGFPCRLPKMMVVISRVENDFWVDELLAVSREQKLEETLENHQRNVVLRKCEFKQIPV
jgi:hypothetical protein